MAIQKVSVVGLGTLGTQIAIQAAHYGYDVRAYDQDPEVFQKMILSNPRIHGIEIPNAGHWVHSEQPHEFLRVLTEFVGQPL